MRAPRFWNNPPQSPGWQARLLVPFGWLYACATRRRLRRGAPGFRSGVPVICIGNLDAGGSGKTPTVIAMVERLAARGIAAHVVSRGYGGSLEGPVRVLEARHTAAEVGDEPLLLAAFGPTWVAKDRAAGARAAAQAGAEAIILDDGFQNPAVAKDLSIVVIDAARAFGNARVIPAGPLREPVRAGLARADMVLTIGTDAAQARFSTDWAAALGTLPRVTGALVPLQTGMQWRGLRVLAFAGIGQPAKFFRTLRDLGAKIIRAQALDDHQPLNETLLQRMKAEAKLRRAQLVTTEKDAVRLPAAWRREVLTVPVRLKIGDAGALEQALDRLFANRTPLDD